MISEENAVEILVKCFKRYVSSVRWKEVFVTGTWKFRHEKDEMRQEQLIELFNVDQMLQLASDLQKVPPYRLKDELKNKLKNRFLKFESEEDAEIDTNNLLSILIENIKDTLSEDDLFKVWLSEGEDEIESDIHIIIEKLDIILGEQTEKYSEDILSTEDVNHLLETETIEPHLSLSYFVIDDEDFINEFNEEFGKKEIITVIGQNKEETAYCLMWLLKYEHKTEREVYIVKSSDAWKYLKKQSITDAVLIPLFVSDTITAIPNNTIIFVKNRTEYPDKKSLHIRRRLRSTLNNCLMELGFSSKEAYDLICKTHGYYTALKRELFNGSSYCKRSFPESKINSALTALFCGRWEDCEGDREIIEFISGETYDRFYSDIMPFMLEEDPYVIEIKGYGNTKYCITDNEKAWLDLKDKVNEKLYDKLIEAVRRTVGYEEAVYNLPVEQHYMSSIIAPNRYSEQLKKGLIESLIYCTDCAGYSDFQIKNNRVIKELLDSVDSKVKWMSISPYLSIMCECSPEIYVQRLERELEQSTEMSDLFSQSYHYIYTEHYDAAVINALEIAMHEPELFYRASYILLRMYALGLNENSTYIDDSIHKIFCPFIDELGIKPEKKIEFAHACIEKYPDFWDLLIREFNGKLMTYVPFAEPVIKYYGNGSLSVQDEASTIRAEYFRLCLNNVNGAAQWCELISASNFLCDDCFVQLIDEITNAVIDYSDEDKSVIKNYIRSQISESRKYSAADWALGEERLKKLESLMESIVIHDKTYNYVHVFIPAYDYPLLHPMSYADNDDSFEKNYNLALKEIEASIHELKKKRIDLRKILSKVNIQNNGGYIGFYLASYYDDEFNEGIFKLLLEQFSQYPDISINYFNVFQQQNSEVIKTALDIAGREGAGVSYITKLLKAEPWELKEKSRICYASEDQKIDYWCSINYVSEKEPGSLQWALNECGQYGNCLTYVTILESSLDIIDDQITYDQLLKIPKGNLEKAKLDTLFQYKLEKVLRHLYDTNNYFDHDEEIGLVELRFRNVLDFNEMLFTRHWMRRSPQLMIELVNAFYSKDPAVKPEVKSDLFSLLQSIDVCPAVYNGEVDAGKLKEWIQQFETGVKAEQREIIINRYLGKLFAHAPADKNDGIIPCCEVRNIIEEKNNRVLNDGFATEVINKRGAYWGSAGSEEKRMSEKYKRIAEKLTMRYPSTASIYYSLSSMYREEYLRERSADEDAEY